MNKKTGTYNGICGRKWRLTFIVLILVFSIISVSATGAQSSTKSQASNGTSQEQYVDECNGINIQAVDMGQEQDAGWCNETEKIGSERECTDEETGGNNSTGSVGVSTGQYIDSGNGAKTRVVRVEQESDSGSSHCGKPTCKYCASKEKNPDASLSKKTEKKGSLEKNLYQKTGESKSLENLDEKVEDEVEDEKVEDEKVKGNKVEDEVEDEKVEDEAEEKKIEEKKIEEKKVEEKKVEEKTGIGSDVGNQKSIGDNQKKGIYNVIDEQKYIVKIPEQSEEVETEVKTKTCSSKECLESGKTEQKPSTDINKETPGEKSVDKGSESKTELDSESQAEESEDQDFKLEETAGNETGDSEDKEESPDQKSGGDSSTGSRENIGNKSKPSTGTEKEVEIPEDEGTSPEQETGGNNSTGNHKDIGSGVKPATGIEKGIEIPESSNITPEKKTGGNNSSAGSEEKVEGNKGTYNETYTQENTVEVPEQEQDEGDDADPKLEIRTGNKTKIQKSVGTKTESDTGNKTEIKKSIGTTTESDAGNKTDIKKSTGTKTESKTQVYNGTKSLKSAAVETKPKTKACNITKDLESKNVKPETKIKICCWTKSLKNQAVKPEVKVCNWTSGPENNWTYGPENNWTSSPENEVIVTEIEPEVSGWNNLKFILSYPYSFSSFYTVNESVKIGYKGSEALGKQNVYVYLVKERKLTSSEENISNTVNGSTIRLEDVLNNNNTEYYIQIPSILNEGGDLSPLTLGPLPAGSYWVVITLAENETEKPESGEEVLLANYFEVLEHEMEAKAPYTLEEGENFEVDLNLKNAPAEKSYTYWTMLIREDACTADGSTSPGWTAAGTRPLVNGVDIIKNLEANLAGYGAGAGKEEIKSEIQSLIGEGNGTIDIGEANQRTLSLASRKLPAGNYILITGAYENDEGLAGVAERELRISAENSYGSGLKSSSSKNTFGSMPSMKNKAPSFTGISSILETPKAFMFEDARPYIQAKTLVEIVKHPPKIPSFLLGFAGALLIGFAIMRKKK